MSSLPTARRSILPLMALLCLAPATQAQSPAEDPQSYQTALAHIDSLRTHGHFNTALARTDSLRNRYPSHVEVPVRRALLLADLGKKANTDEQARQKFTEALHAADRALEIDSTAAWAHLVKALAEGRLTLHVGRSERVRRSRAVKKHADRAIRLDSTIAPAYHLRGRWHREVATLNFIQRTLVKAFYGGLPDASVQQAVRDFQRAIALESQPYNHLELGKTYLQMDRPDAARRQFQIALETSGSPFDAEYKREARSLLRQMD